MGMTTVVVFNKRKQPRLEVRHRSEIASLQEPSFQDAKPQFHLIEPGAMRRSEDESACSVSNVVLLASRGLARHSRVRWAGTTPCLHSRLSITADHQSPLLPHHGCREVQLADCLSPGVEVRVVAVEPIDATLRLQVGLVES